MIIILEQREFGKVKQAVASVLRGADNVRLRLGKRAKNSASKEIAKSLDKDFTKKKIEEIKAAYGNKPEIAKRKIEKVKKHSRGRRAEYEKGAKGKFEALKPANPKTAEQIEATAEKIVNPKLPTIEQVKDKTLKAGRSVLEGAKRTYENTGQVLTEAGVKLREHPVAAPGWFSGDAVNIVASATGHPEMVAVPVGSIAGAAGLAGETGLFPRKVRRKFRQNAINYRKRRESGAARKGFQKLTPSHDWSLKKQAQEAQQYSRHLGIGGRINYSAV